MSIQGATIDYPFRADVRGSLATTANITTIVEQSIASILETRQGERVMLPDYGIPDFVFDVIDAGFSARLAFFLEGQVRKYEPLVEDVRGRVGFFDDDRFVPGFVEDQQRAAVSVEYRERGSNVPRNLIFPTWGLREGLEAAQ